MVQRRRGAVAVSVLAGAALLLAGCGNDTDDNGGGDEAAEASPVEEAATTEEAATGTGADDTDDTDGADDTDATAGEAATATGESVTAQQAAQIALDEVAGAVVEIDRDDNGVVVWEVLVRADDGSGVEVDVDAATGEVRGRDDEDVPDEAQAGPPAVTAVQAMDTAVGEVPGGVVRELDLDDEDGRIVWEVDVDADTGTVDVTVDASTGDVLDTDTDDTDDDDDGGDSDDGDDDDDD